MNAKHRQTLVAVLDRPVLSNIRWTDIEALLIALGAERFLDQSGDRPMNTLTHDGFIAELEIDEGAGLIHGRVVNARCSDLRG